MAGIPTRGLSGTFIFTFQVLRANTPRGPDKKLVFYDLAVSEVTHFCCLHGPAWVLGRQHRPHLSMGEIPMSHLRIVRGDFLGSPVIRTLCFHLAPQPVKVKMLVAHLCPSLHNPIDCSPPGSSVHGIPQTRILEWVAIPFSRALVQSLVGGLRSCKPHEAAKNKQERKKYEQTVQNTRNTKEY